MLQIVVRVSDSFAHYLGIFRQLDLESAVRDHAVFLQVGEDLLALYRTLSQELRRRLADPEI